MFPLESQSLHTEQVVHDSRGEGISLMMLPDRAFLCLELCNLSAGRELVLFAGLCNVKSPFLARAK